MFELAECDSSWQGVIRAGRVLGGALNQGQGVGLWANVLSHALGEHRGRHHGAVGFFVAGDLGAAAVDELPCVRRPARKGHALVRPQRRNLLVGPFLQQRAQQNLFRAHHHAVRATDSDGRPANDKYTRKAIQRTIAESERGKCERSETRVCAHKKRTARPQARN